MSNVRIFPKDTLLRTYLKKLKRKKNGGCLYLVDILLCLQSAELKEPMLFPNSCSDASSVQDC